MSWNESIDSAGGTFDGLDGQIPRVFNVWGGVTVEQIHTDPTKVDNGNGEFLPGYGTSHPKYPGLGLVLTHYTCSTNGLLITAVANYATPGSFGGVLDPSKRIGTSFERRVIDIPYAEEVPLDVGVNGGNLIVYRWALRTRPLIHNFQRIEYRTTVKSVNWGGMAAEIIRAAIGEIHFFGFDGAPAVHWQYTGCEVEDRIKNEDVTLSHFWTRDSGTRVFNIVDQIGTYALPKADKKYEGKDWVRPPFTGLGFAIDWDNGPPFPYFPLIETEFSNDQGWTLLPGVP